MDDPHLRDTTTGSPPPTTDPATVNGQPGLRFRIGDEIGSVMSLEIADGVIQTIRGVTNPDKLDHLGPVVDTRAVLRQARTP